MTPHEIAFAAHRIESELLKQQSGIQDQIASAFGGINYIDMYEYPYASVSQIRVPDATWWELESRLSLIYIGQTHSSSKTHEMVIRNMEDAGPDAPQLRAMRITAQKSKDAVYAGDFDALGRAMIENTEAQRSLHPALVGPRHQEMIDIASNHGAVGWKVNGAGGAGGSVTLLSGGDRRQRRTMLEAVLNANSEFRKIPIFLSRMGVRTWIGHAERSGDGRMLNLPNE
jgi:D-glycero-alpha-D-manno-heptose-7-phosphate kinase